MPDTRRTVDRQGATDPGAGERGAHTPGAEQHGATQSPESKSPGAAAVSGGDGSRSQAPQARDVDEDALRGDVDELAAVAAQRDEYLALAQRTQADFENYRKRVAKESMAAQQRGVIKLAEELLPALDNLDRALAEGAAAAARDKRDSPLLEGLRLVRSELHAALARQGIESFSPKDAPFDPSEHEAVAHQRAEGVPSGTVAEVFQPGYRLGSCIIRPARVLVAA